MDHNEAVLVDVVVVVAHNFKQVLGTQKQI